ncbi:sesquiterpene synthase 14b-like [Lycium ferocissimum]|uniref:sesquiterpene synthase 14b-like n=1 Tax=Lycium ferocissimum TaxID=112874 RepID=UPI002815EF13|nr:sesquiterpene synthase 14b-like [Lycium ferocissimum]
MVKFGLVAGNVGLMGLSGRLGNSAKFEYLFKVGPWLIGLFPERGCGGYCAFHDFPVEIPLQHRHYVSSDVFKKFTNQDRKFKETLTKDVQGLLSLYEAAHLRVHGEEILEEALSFTITHLESMVPKMSNSLKAQLSEALCQPIHTNLPRMTARKYISIYENIESHNDLLLKFAKIDFNIVQKVRQKELGELTRWWKDLNFAEKFPYARDRLVECHFYTVGIYFEPQYSRAREMMTKVLTIYTVIDDTYDAFATYDELVLFTYAIYKCGCNISVIDSVPPSLRPTYQALVDVYTQIEEKMIREGKLDRLYYAKYEVSSLISGIVQTLLDPGYHLF